LLTRSKGMWRRRRGQTEAGSWAARIVARTCGTVVVVLVVSGFLVSAGATAATPRLDPNPSPQKAPTSGAASQPTPDPAPHATSTVPAPHQSTPAEPPIRVPVDVAPARTDNAPAANTVTASHAHVSRPPAPSGRPASTQHARVPRASASHRAGSQATRLSFPLGLPRDLLLPRVALHAGTDSRGDGVLLLLSAVAMVVLTLASLALLRRLRRLELR